MARNIDSACAKKVIIASKTFLNNIDAVCKYASTSASEIASLSEALVKYDAGKALENIPIEELNRDKKGFRIKTLRDNGYINISDIEKASVSDLSKINGISPQSANEIKKKHLKYHKYRHKAYI